MSDEKRVESYGPKLQQACSSCRKKKKKCDRLQPVCTRCISQGETCFYDPPKKRGRKTSKKKKNLSNKFTKTEKDLIQNLFLSLNSPEPCIFSVNFQIFGKEHLSWKLLEFFTREVSNNSEALSSVPCSDLSSFFCAAMLYQLGNHLAYRAKHDGTFTHAVNTFTEIVTQKGLTYSGVLETLQKQFYRGNELEKKQKLVSNYSSLRYSPFLLDAAANYPSFKQSSKGVDSENLLSLDIKYEVNAEFEAMFGYSSEHLEFVLAQSVNGVLPAGSNVISLLGSEEAVMKYMNMYAVEVQHSSFANEDLIMPVEMELCNSVILDLQTRNGCRKFQVFTLTYETGSFKEYLCENRIHFMPLESPMPPFFD
eukprot:snap_masked-scaffold_8-processed-gene-7.37-mRNA-1 protein AED:1.00 eAED:1.00 QI:0/-1/0/0/-1/1/1/0/365